MDRYIKSSSFNMIHLCIDYYNKYQVAGRAYNNTVNDEIDFQDIPEFILKIDKIFDNNGNPISSQEKRSFRKENSEETIYQNKPQILKDYTEYDNINGKIATMDIVVKTRFSSNWQGFIFCDNQAVAFKGIVELVDKIESFL